MSSEVTIYDRDGNTRLSTPVNMGSRRVRHLGGDDYISLKFNLAAPIAFALGDYCDLPDEYGGGRYEVAQPQKPQYNAATGGYEYELRLDAQYRKWAGKVMRYMPRTGGLETSFTLTADLPTHLRLVLDNLEALARDETLADGTPRSNACFLYNGATPWSGACNAENAAAIKTIAYQDKRLLDALADLATEWDCDWWVDDSVIHIGKCELENEYIDLELGRNVAQMERSDSTEAYVTRVIPYGSQRNISPRYRKELIFTVTDVEGDNGGTTLRVRDAQRPLYWDVFPEALQVSPAPQTLVGSAPANLSYDVFGRYVMAQSREKELVGDNGQSLKGGTWHLKVPDFLISVAAWREKGWDTTTPWVLDLTVVVEIQPDPAENTRREVYRQTYTERWDIDEMGMTQNVDNIDAEYGTRRDLPPGHYAEFTEADVSMVAGCKKVWVRLEVTLTSGHEGRYQLQLTPRGQFQFTERPSIRGAAGLTMEVLSSNGKDVARTIEGVAFNRAFSAEEYGRNWFTLPAGVSMSVGDRFRFPNTAAKKQVLEYKVKSSYFTAPYLLDQTDGQIIKNGVVASRLMLPLRLGKPYVDFGESPDGALLPREQAVEDVVVFEDVYPRALCTVTSVERVQRNETVENDDGTSSDRDFVAFVVADDIFTSAHPFDEDYRLPDTQLQAVFQDGRRYKAGDTIPAGKTIGDLVNPESGKLNGWTFDLTYRRASDGSARWEIVRDAEAFVPNEVIAPQVGDQFVITGIDAVAVNEVLVQQAEEELYQRTLLYLQKHNADPSTYDCTMMPDVMLTGLNLQLGTRVNLINEAFLPTIADAQGRRWGRKSRVIGYEYPLDIPYDNPVYTIGEKAAYSRLGEISDNIEALKYAMQSKQGFTSGVFTPVAAASGSLGMASHLIGTTDTTKPSDSNIFSALRSLREFCSQKAAQLINYVWTFRRGLRVGEDDRATELSPSGMLNVGTFLTGMQGAAVWLDSQGVAHMETDVINVRRKIEARSVEIAQMQWVGGMQILSPAAATLTDVVYDAANAQYYCYFPAKDADGKATDIHFRSGDLVRCETFGEVSETEEDDGGICIEPLTHFYWRRVIGFNRGEGTHKDDFVICLSDSEGHKAPNSDAPRVGDRVITCGSATDTGRQQLIVMAVVGTGAPYIRQFAGIDSFSLSVDKIVTQLSKDGNIFRGTFYLASGAEVTAYISDSISTEVTRLDSSLSSKITQTADSIKTEIADGLGNTGIDITAGRIVARANNFLIQSSTGDPVAAITADGKIAARCVEVADVNANRVYCYAVDADGQFLYILTTINRYGRGEYIRYFTPLPGDDPFDPAKRLVLDDAITWYNRDGSKVWTLDENGYTLMAQQGQNPGTWAQDTYLAYSEVNAHLLRVTGSLSATSVGFTAVSLSIYHRGNLPVDGEPAEGFATANSDPAHTAFASIVGYTGRVTRPGAPKTLPNGNYFRRVCNYVNGIGTWENYYFAPDGTIVTPLGRDDIDTTITRSQS